MAEVDQQIKCKDCPSTFEFTVGEQQFFAERQFTPPVRCKPCRERRKAEKNAAGAAPASPNTGFTRPVVVETLPPRRPIGHGGGKGKRQRGDAWDRD
jgi:hypothetical protein